MELATSGPMVIGGTKRPSMTSTWISRAPASMTSPTCAPRREKSAERMEGATRLPENSSRRDSVPDSVAASTSDAPQHRVAAVLAPHVLGSAHAADGLMLAAVRTLRDELEAAQTVHADEAARKLCRAQPRLTAAGAIWPAGDALSRLGGRFRSLGRASQATVGSFGHVTRVARLGGAARDVVTAKEVRRAHRLAPGGLDLLQPQRSLGAAEQQLVLLGFEGARLGPVADSGGPAYPEPLPALELE